jgi:hypothetical protein
VEAFGSAVEVAYDEVPVARVGSKGDDAFVGQRLCDDFSEMKPSEKNLVAKFVEHVM